MIIERHNGDVTILELRTTNFTIGNNVELREAILEQLAKGHRNIVIDMHNVARMDSSGTGELVSAYTAVTSQGGRMVFANLPERIRDIFTIHQLIGVFKVYDTDEEAIRSLVH